MTYLIVSIIAAWCALSYGVGVPDYFLPTPKKVIAYIINNPNLLGRHAILTALEIAGGLLLALAATLLTGYWTHKSDTAQKSFMSFFLIMQAIPMFVLLPLFVLWFGTGGGVKVLVVALSAYFPMAASLIQGISQCPATYRDLARAFHAKPNATWRHVLLPSALPHLLSGIRIAAVHAPITVLAADWIGSTNGLGYLIMLGHGRMQLDLMFSCILIFVMMALSLNALVAVAQNRLLYWKNEGV